MVIIVKLNKTMVKDMEKKITYNPMSKEFQDECKKLGLTGRELTLKYKKEGKVPEKDEIYSHGNTRKKLGYVKGDICYRCKEDNNVTNDSILCPGKTYREKDENWKDTGNYVCYKHWRKYYDKYCSYSSCSMTRSVTNCRTNNQKLNSNQEKGDISLELACILYGWEDLNKKYNNFRTPIDCYDPKTGLYHQVRGRRYDSTYKLWNTGPLEREWIKKYEDMVLICQSGDGKKVEEMYIIPHIEIKKRKNISIVKNPTDCAGSSIISWYRKYRITNEDELKKANKILKFIEDRRR